MFDMVTDSIVFLDVQVASLVTLNAGVAVSIEKVNIAIAEVDAQLELVVRLGEPIPRRECRAPI